MTVTSSFIQPSNKLMIRLPYEAFTSEWVTWIDRDTFVIQLFEQLHNLFALRGMQVSGWLVCQNQAWIGDHRSCDGDQLLLTSGELVGIEIFLSDHLETIQAVAYNRLAFAAFDVAIRERNIEVLVNRQAIEQVISAETRTQYSVC